MDDLWPDFLMFQDRSLHLSSGYVYCFILRYLECLLPSKVEDLSAALSTVFIHQKKC